MTAARLMDWRGVLAALTVTAATVAVGSAVDSRDRVLSLELRRDMDIAVQVEQHKAILASLAEIKTKLGIPCASP